MGKGSGVGARGWGEQVVNWGFIAKHLIQKRIFGTTSLKYQLTNQPLPKQKNPGTTLGTRFPTQRTSLPSKINFNNPEAINPPRV